MSIESLSKGTPIRDKSASVPNKSLKNDDHPVKNNLQNPVQTIHNMDSEELFQKDFIKTLETEEGKKHFETVLEAANEIIFGPTSHFKFQIHEGTGTTMVKIVDNETEKVIKELPPEKILNVIAGIWELAGIIVDEKA